MLINCYSLAGGDTDAGTTPTKDEAASRVYHLNGGFDKEKLERIDDAFGYLLDGFKMSATRVYAGLEPMINEAGDYF